MWQEARPQRPLPSLCFFGPIGKKCPPPWPLSDWLRHFRLLLWNNWKEFNKTWQEARSQRHLSSLCFSSRSEKQEGRPGLWLAGTFSTSPLEPAERNSTKLDRRQDLNILYQVCVFRTDRKNKMATLDSFGPIGKTKWPPNPLICWDMFNFSSETTEQNSTKVDRKQDLNILYQVCVFRADHLTNMATLADPFSSETAEQNSTKVHRKQDLNILYQVCVFRADQ